MRPELRALPQPFLDRLQRIYSPQQWHELAKTFAASRPTTFRTNTLKTDARSVHETLHGHGFGLERIPWFPGAFLLRSGRLRDLQETELYRRGAIYVQSLSSLLPPLVLDPKPGERVLDLAAAPGSKTTQMACLMEGQGRILAVDNHRTRFYRLKANVELQGAWNVELSLGYGESVGKTHPDTFDRVLVDAPCSAEGRFQVNEPASYRYWKPRKVVEMARKQRRLLRAGLQALRPGGVLVYSTCTFAPEENEAVVDWALRQFGEAVALEPIAVPLTNCIAGLREWESARFDPTITRTVRILPTPQMDGFFLARLSKRASLIGDSH